MPKSVTFTVPSGPTIRLAGFTSRWITPDRCAAWSASAVWLRIDSLVAVDRAGCSTRSSESVRPEPLDERRCGPQLVLEDLDRDSPGQQEVGPFPDLAHPAHGDLSCQHVAATEYLVALGPHVLYVPFAGRR